MIVVYPVIFTQTHDEKDTVLVEIPDIEGMTEGYGMADAINMARDYIGETFYSVDDEEVTPASRAEEIDISKGTFAAEGDSIVSYVDTDLDAHRRKMNSKSVRKNVSIPSWLNEAAEREHINVSRVLQDALMERLNIAR
ncbi:MAG: HicB family protein [Butyrivibrio sp.]|uniref:HicB family protein n=1 Tax=Butyrivibrio sp. TaxID=28121 RepID=UPI001B447A16|nr:HicB family protein [Butyrivibrio sp.]MBP3784589.1 HicB family protein [Butyrivibrio sp.]